MFDIFSAPAPAAPSPEAPADAGVCALVRAFAAAHVTRTRADLRAAGKESLAVGLASAAASLAAEPSDMSAVELQAAAVDAACWSALTSSGWSDLCLPKAFVLSKLMRAAACAQSSMAGALRHLDAAFALGGPSAVLKDCILLCAPASTGSSASAGRHERKRQRQLEKPAAAPTVYIYISIYQPIHLSVSLSVYLSLYINMQIYIS